MWESIAIIMDTPEMSLLLVGSPPCRDDLTSVLSNAGWSLRTESTVEDARARLVADSSDSVDCLLVATGSPYETVSALEEVRPLVPILALLPDSDSDSITDPDLDPVPDPDIPSDPTADPATILEAGATDYVVQAGSIEAWGPLLCRRLEVARDRALERIASRALYDGAHGTDAALHCLFDAELRHVVAVGGALGRGLEASSLEGVAIDELAADGSVDSDDRSESGLDPGACTHLEANYVAALEGTARRREFRLRGRPYAVETTPVPDLEGRFGIARYRPVPETTPRETRDKLDRLSAIASELDEYDDESLICRRTVETAAQVLEFDACSITERIDDELVPLAATASDPSQSLEYHSADDGIAGETLRRGKSIVVDDIRDDPVARSTDDRYRSGLSIPVGEFGVFQAASVEPRAFSDTDRELAELLVSNATHAIERVRYDRTITRERDRFAALFQNVPDAAVQYVVETDESGEPKPIVEAVNAAFVRLFGYEPVDAIGQSTCDLLVPDDDEALEAARSLYNTVAQGERLEAEVTRLGVDGLAPFLLRSAPVGTDGDDQRGYFIYTDIGELVERERQLERQNERLDTFASVVSHDLRNPLSIASGYLETALDTGEREHLHVVAEEHDRMYDMIEDLLQLARQGDSIGDVEPVDLEAVAERSWDGVDTADATLSIESVPAVEGDADRLQHLFENLFRNAVLHGGDQVSVTVGTCENGFYVEDDGPGIPDMMKDEVLEMGVSTAKGQGGNGFGLAIVSEIAVAHGWRVDVVDGAAGGARFEISIDESRLGGLESLTGGAGGRDR